MKLQINVSDDMVKQVDYYAKLMGISRSSLCANFIGQGILGFNKSYKILDALGDKLGDELIKQIEESEV